ncbi:hypothetical protein B0H19DRAFT_1104604 [Mycena capillaripes]|nr:hypothetical protein B0H19DRAFT_1104604 [Mycena capillaripes]
MDAGLPQSIIVALQNLFTSRYVTAAGYVVTVSRLYDHLLTLDDEVEYIWSAPTTLAKVLFLILRYMVPLFMTGEAISASLPLMLRRADADHPPAARSGFCKIWNSATTYAGWCTIVISNFLVLLRIWATLPRGHRLIAWSFAFFVVMQLASFAVTTWVISANMIPVFYYDAAIGLCSFSSKPNVSGLWIPGIMFEVIVFVTVCWNALDRPRALDTDSEAHITRILFRDGVVYFVVPLRVANTILAVVAPVSLIFVAVYFIWAATTVTTSRLIINSRCEVGQAERRQELRIAEPEADTLRSMHEMQDMDTKRRSRSASYTRWSKGGSFWA